MNAAPSEADRVALNGHLQAISRLNERLAGNRERALELLPQAADLAHNAEKTVAEKLQSEKQKNN